MLTINHRNDRQPYRLHHKNTCLPLLIRFRDSERRSNKAEEHWFIPSPMAQLAQESFYLELTSDRSLFVHLFCVYSCW